MVKQIMGAAGDALKLTGGQAAVRLIPGLANLPRGGTVGLAIDAATAVVVGLAADQFLSSADARIVTAGAISVPLQRALNTYVAPLAPIVGTALTPTMGSYSRRRRLSGYPRPALPSGNGSRVASSGGFEYGNGFTAPSVAAIL